MSFLTTRAKQEFVAGMGAVLLIGLDRITVPDDYRLLELEKVRDRASKVEVLQF